MQRIQPVLSDAGHGRDRLFPASALLDEYRIDQILRLQHAFAHHGADGGIAAQPSPSVKAHVLSSQFCISASTQPCSECSLAVMIRCTP